MHLSTTAFVIPIKSVVASEYKGNLNTHTHDHGNTQVGKINNRNNHNGIWYDKQKAQLNNLAKNDVRTSRTALRPANISPYCHACRAATAANTNIIKSIMPLIINSMAFSSPSARGPTLAYIVLMLKLIDITDRAKTSNGHEYNGP